MPMLSDDDLNLRDMNDEELGRAWDLWFDLVQETNDHDPPYTHGVFAYLTREDLGLSMAPSITDQGAGSIRNSAPASSSVRR